MITAEEARKMTGFPSKAVELMLKDIESQIILATSRGKNSCLFVFAFKDENIIYEEVFVMNGIATVFTSGEIEAPVKE